MKPLDPRLLRYARAARTFLGLGALLGLAQTVCVVASAWFLSRLVVGAIAAEDPAILGASLASLAGVVVARSVLGWLLEVASARGAALVKSQLRSRVLSAVTRLGPGWVGSRNAAAIATVTGPGLDALDTYFSRYLPQLILTAIATPIVVLVIALQDWQSALSVVVTLPIIPVFMVLIGWATQAVQRRQWTLLTRLSSGFLDVVEGLSTLTLFGRQHRQAARIQQVTEEYRVQTMKVLRVSFLSGFVLELVSSLAVAVVAVSVGIRLIDGSLGLSVGLFVLLLAPEAFLPLRQVGAQFHAAADGVAAAEDVFEILDAAAVRAEAAPGPDSASGSAPVARGEVLPADALGPAALGPDALGPAAGERKAGRGALTLDGLSVSYGDRVVLSGVTARFPRGVISAITGPSGSGKSTLVAALLGFVPYEGGIRLDGRAADTRDSVSAPPWLAWAGQRPGLLSGTVLENITLGSARPDRGLAARALTLAAAPDIPLELALGVGGAGLSGGQAHRVAIARALYRVLQRDCAVLVLDEPSSALDQHTEDALIDGLRVLAARGVAVVVVTHRPGIIAAADERLRIEHAVAVV